MLIVDHLEAGYGKITVLKGISFEVPKGKIVSLIGSNGAGKTTTMRALSGMLTPHGGNIRFKGERITGKRSDQIAQLGVAHSPEGRRVFTSMSVHDNLILGAYTRLRRGEASKRIQSDLQRMFDLFPRLAERKTQLAGTLSGGEQQMLAMARALMMNPDLILLDEPSMGLAPILVAEIFAIIRRLREDGVTMLLVEQFASAALKVSDYGYVLEHGKIALHDSAERLSQNPAVIAAYLGGAAGH
jgi:branched-chain amino acid transport system ATP-binding protein